MPKVIRRARRCGRHSAVLALVVFGASAVVLFMFLQSPPTAHPPTPDQFEALPPQPLAELIQYRKGFNERRHALPPMQPVQAAAAALHPRSFEAHPPVETAHVDSLGRPQGRPKTRTPTPMPSPKPTAMPSPAPTSATGWTKHHDAKSGRDYWFNQQSGVSTWNDPSKPRTAPPTNAPTNAPTAAAHLKAPAVPLPPPLPPQSSTALKAAATVAHTVNPAPHQTAPLTPNQKPPSPLLPAGGPKGRLAQPAAAASNGKPVADYETVERRKRVVSAMQHAWGGYKQCAWGEYSIWCQVLSAVCARR